MMKIFKKHHDWPDVKKICQTLNQNGFKAWLAGGCVRDGLLGLVPNDFDIATDAKPVDVERLFQKTVSVGKFFGVIRVICKSGADIEVVRFRRDGIYSDGRHPDDVEPGSPEEDAQRRDFTINALFYDLIDLKIYDFVGGLGDLKRKVIRTVGTPEARFSEDHLRILRAARFTAQLGFKIDPQTIKAMRALSHTVSDLSRERIHDELEKLFKAKYLSQGMELFRKTGLESVLLPELEKKHKTSTFKKIVKTDTPVDLSWMLILREIPVEKQASFFARLKFSHGQKERLKAALNIFESLEGFKSLTLSEKKKVASRQEVKLAVDFFKLHKKMAPKVSKFLTKNTKLPKPFITSSDLISLDIKPGRLFGELLSKAYENQLEETFVTRSAAIKWLKKLLTLETDQTL